MKAFYLLSFCLLTFVAGGMAQPSLAKAYDKNSSVISAGYGFINVWEIYLDKVLAIPDYKVHSTGPLTLMYEYGLNKHFSAGISGSYSRVNGKAAKYQISDQISFISGLIRANYHLWTTAKFDPYFGGGIGISNSKYKNLDPHTIIPDANKNVPSTFDFCGQVGIRYYPLQSLGVFVETGYVNGAIINAGISCKFL